jgi:hypothetical protein
MALSAGLAGALAAAVVWGYLARKARAEGIPAGEAMVYRGLLEENGAPAPDKQRAFRVRLWDDPTQGKELCSREWNTSTKDGRFEVPLDAVCTNAVHASPNSWVEVEVDGTKLPRTKVSAVPYAVEADRAVKAGMAEVVTNPWCASRPCVDSDVTQVEVTASVPAAATKNWSVFCPQSRPIPVTAGCAVGSTVLNTLDQFPIHWGTPSTWASSIESSRAGFECHFENRSSSAAANATAIIVCRK